VLLFPRSRASRGLLRANGLWGGDPICHLRDLLTDRINFCALFRDHMLFDLADVGVDLTQDIMLRLGELPQLREQGILPCGDAVHPPETDKPGADPHPRQSVCDRRSIHRSLDGSVVMAPLFLRFHAIAPIDTRMVSRTKPAQPSTVLASVV
jgi:hypothetical protein